MTLRNPLFKGEFPGIGNIKDLSDMSKYGTLLISNINPVSFMQHFITDDDNSVINSTRLIGEDYYQFKLNLIKTISSINQTLSPSDALDAALIILNDNKATTFPYYYSDMLPTGNNAIVRNYKIKDLNNTTYGLPNGRTLTNIRRLVSSSTSLGALSFDGTFTWWGSMFDPISGLTLTSSNFPTRNTTTTGIYNKLTQNVASVYSCDDGYVFTCLDGSMVSFGIRSFQALTSEKATTNFSTKNAGKNVYFVPNDGSILPCGAGR
jgi:hypothetical protein